MSELNLVLRHLSVVLADKTVAVYEGQRDGDYRSVQRQLINGENPKHLGGRRSAYEPVVDNEEPATIDQPVLKLVLQKAYIRSQPCLEFLFNRCPDLHAGPSWGRAISVL